MVAAILLGFAAVSARQPGSPRDLYAAALAREQQVRATVSSPAADRASALHEFRALIDAYRAIVWQYPNSGYCDNALWQGGHLAADAFVMFGEERDRLTAVAMLGALVSEYPSSGFVARARADSAKLEREPAPAQALMPATGLPAGVVARSGASAPSKDGSPATPPGGGSSTGTDAPAQGASVAPGPSPAAKAAAAPDATSPKEPQLVSVRAIRRIAGADSVQITIEMDGPVSYYEERLDKPPRVFFDLANTRTVEALRDAVLNYETDVVRQIRVGRHPNQVTRVVLDLDGVAHYRARALRDPFRLVVDCFRNGVVSRATPAEPVRGPGPSPAIMTSPAVRAAKNPEPALSPPVVFGVQLPLEPAPKAEPSAAAPGLRLKPSPPPAADQPSAPASNLSGGYSLARQLGLGVGRVVIDAGHGGRDPGALGPGVTEAEITLDIALRLERLLLKEPGLDVIMTRRADVYVPLEERTAIANRAGADMFLSIHCNAARDPAINGVETYSLNFASTAHAATVAARENAAATLPMSSLSDIVRVIALNSKVDESRDLARQVQLSLTRRLRAQNQALRDLGVKQAPFVVLVGASMPSVLAEVAFITNRQEGRLLASETYRQRAAEALLEGISRYQRSLKKTPVFAPQPPAK
jgi:N-acetylmuramoyl-L-alanine amidase